MKIKVKKKVSKKLPAVRCFTIGQRISGIECGLAHAGRGLESGNSKTLMTGLNVASTYSASIEMFFPQERKAIHKIKVGVDRLSGELSRKKRLSREDSTKTMERIRDIAKDVKGLQAKALNYCGAGQ